MTQLALIDISALNDLRADLAEVKRLLARSSVQPLPEWVTIPQAAHIKNCSDETIRRWIREGRIEAKGKGKARRVKV